MSRLSCIIVRIGTSRTFKWIFSQIVFLAVSIGWKRRVYLQVYNSNRQLRCLLLSQNSPFSLHGPLSPSAMISTTERLLSASSYPTRCSGWCTTNQSQTPKPSSTPWYQANFSTQNLFPTVRAFFLNPASYHLSSPSSLSSNPSRNTSSSVQQTPTNPYLWDTACTYCSGNARRSSYWSRSTNSALSNCGCYGIVSLHSEQCWSISCRTYCRLWHRTDDNFIMIIRWVAYEHISLSRSLSVWTPPVSWNTLFRYFPRFWASRLPACSVPISPTRSFWAHCWSICNLSWSLLCAQECRVW